jgi:ribonuclease P protein component
VPRQLRTVFFLYYLENKYVYHRFAISVNRKIGNAVERNFIKRKMKEVFRLNQQILRKKHDIWVVIKKRFNRNNSWEAEELFLKSLQNINMMATRHKVK